MCMCEMTSCACALLFMFQVLLVRAHPVAQIWTPSAAQTRNKTPVRRKADKEEEEGEEEEVEKKEDEETV